MRSLLSLVAVVAATLVSHPSWAEDAVAASLPIELKAQHTFSREEARIRVQQLLDYLSQRYGVERDWEGNVARVRGTVMGVSFDALLVVRDHEVRARTSDPGLLLRDLALDYVTRKLRKYLSPTYAEL